MTWKRVRPWWTSSRADVRPATVVGLASLMRRLLDLVGQWIVVGIVVLIIVLTFVLANTS